jgi:hypothetical protein
MCPRFSTWCLLFGCGIAGDSRSGGPREPMMHLHCAPVTQLQSNVRVRFHHAQAVGVWSSASSAFMSSSPQSPLTCADADAAEGWCYCTAGHNETQTRHLNGTRSHAGWQLYKSGACHSPAWHACSAGAVQKQHGHMRRRAHLRLHLRVPTCRPLPGSLSHAFACT